VAARAVFGLFLLISALFSACTRQAAVREYPLHGQVLAVRPADREIVIRHDDIAGLMPGMTMPFKVKDAGLLKGVEAGDFVNARLEVAGTDAYISQVQKTGRHEPVAAGTALPHVMDPPLRPGEAVPDVALETAGGGRFRPADLAGHAWALTFVYTRCPVPTFCPALERRFLAAQKAILADASLAGTRLVAVTIDPDFDRPAVLRAHASEIGADRRVWTYVTGDRAAIERFGERFGLTVVRGNGTPEELVHSMRTVVVDPKGRVARIFDGTEGDAAALVAALRAASTS
jgi:protein SCO1/2